MWENGPITSSNGQDIDSAQLQMMQTACTLGTSCPSRQCFKHAMTISSPLTHTDAGPLVDIGCVVALQPFTSIARLRLRAHLSFLTGTHQAADTVVQDERHPGGTEGGLPGAVAPLRAHLGPDQCKHLGEGEKPSLSVQLLIK